MPNAQVGERSSLNQVWNQTGQRRSHSGTRHGTWGNEPWTGRRDGVLGPRIVVKTQHMDVPRTVRQGIEDLHHRGCRPHHLRRSPAIRQAQPRGRTQGPNTVAADAELPAGPCPAAPPLHRSCGTAPACLAMGQQTRPRLVPVLRRLREWRYSQYLCRKARTPNPTPKVCHANPRERTGAAPGHRRRSCRKTLLESSRARPTNLLSLGKTHPHLEKSESDQSPEPELARPPPPIRRWKMAAAICTCLPRIGDNGAHSPRDSNPSGLAVFTFSLEDSGITSTTTSPLG